VEVDKTRRANLRSLIARFGKDLVCAKAGYQDHNYLNQLVAPSEPGSFGARTARKIESGLKLPKGWMDQPHEDAGNGQDSDVKLLTDAFLSAPPALQAAALRVLGIVRDIDKRS